MATLEDYFFVKKTKWILWGVFALIIAALIFHAGIVVGSHRPFMQGRGQGGGFEAQIPFGGEVALPQGFIPGSHGALGTIATVTLPTLTLTTRDGMTLTVKVDSGTQIVGATPEGTSTSASLSVGEMVIVVGDPDDTSPNGAVDARLIRIFPN